VAPETVVHLIEAEVGVTERNDIEGTPTGAAQVLKLALTTAELVMVAVVEIELESAKLPLPETKLQPVKVYPALAVAEIAAGADLVTKPEGVPPITTDPP
jgi:hypothetical protein